MRSLTTHSHVEESACRTTLVADLAHRLKSTERSSSCWSSLWYFTPFRSVHQRYGGHFVASFGPQRSVSWHAHSYVWTIYSLPRARSRLSVDLPSFVVPPSGLELCHSYHSIPSRQGQRTSEHRGTAPILFPSQGRKSSRPRAGAAGPPTFVHLTSYPPLIHEKVFKTSLERNSTNEL